MAATAASPPRRRRSRTAPTSRSAEPLYIYVNTDELKSNAALQPFMQYYVDNVNDIAPQVGFIPMTDEQLSASESTVQGS